jgi:hypothetical protein
VRGCTPDVDTNVDAARLEACATSGREGLGWSARKDFSA